MLYNSRKPWSIGLGLFFIICTSTASALACSCLAERSTCLAYGESKAVFVGKVTEGKSAELMSEMLKGRLKTGAKDQEFKFTVSRAFAGVKAGESLTIHTGFGFGDCGFPFQAGEEYVVYAYQNEEGQLATNICTRTRKATPEHIRDLAALSSNSGAEISGKLKRYERSSMVGSPDVAVPGFSVQLVHVESGRAYEAKTDVQGVFKYRSLPGGKYRLDLTPESGWVVDDERESIVTVNDNGCAEQDVKLVNDSQVGGIVLGPNDEPVAKVWVELIPVDATIKNSVVPSGFTTTESSGRFSSENVPPGRYTVSINYLNAPDDEQPYPTVFAPNSSDRANARVIEVRPGTKIDDITIKIPARLQKLSITGVVLWPDGKPVKKDSMGLSDIVAGDSCVNGCVETDEQGRFTVTGYPGRKYSIWARGDKEIRKRVVSYRFDSPPFEITSPNMTFRIKLKYWRTE